MNETSMGDEPKPLPVETSSQCQAFHLNSRTASAPCASPRPAETSIAKARSEPRNEPPIAVSAMRRTASLPRRLPNTPFTKAPSAGSPKMMAISVKFSAGKMFLRRSIEGLVPEQIGLVAAHRAGEAVDREADGEADRGLG